MREAKDMPSTRFKVAVCMHAMGPWMGQGGRLKLTADAASLGTSTVRKWMQQFCVAVIHKVKPVYMPCKPFTHSRRCVATLHPVVASLVYL